MSVQLDHDEVCENCGDTLTANVNWTINDVMSNALYCIKEQCQESKPIIMKAANKINVPKEKKPKERDRGLSTILKKIRLHIRFAPDAARVAQWAEYIVDPKMLNEQGFPKYSKIFREYGAYGFATGYESAEMAVAQYPNEVNAEGCPSTQSVNAITNYLKGLTKRYDGTLEIYSTRGVKESDPGRFRRVWRWHTLKEKADLDKQVDDMRAIAKNIELSAKKREVNFGAMTFEQRMEKASILDQFFA